MERHYQWLAGISRGFRSLVSALMLAYGQPSIPGKLWTTVAVMPVMLFSCLDPLAAALAGCLVGWLNFMMIMNSSNALMQSQMPDHLRGGNGVCLPRTFLVRCRWGVICRNGCPKFGEPLTVMLGAIVLMVLAISAWIFACHSSRITIKP
jgi:hypothetical protein